ncbi:hypothetical protein GCM10027162_50990 [Streptomyces incanus]
MASGPVHLWARVGAAWAERAEGRSGARSGAGKRARRSGAQPGLDRSRFNDRVWRPALRTAGVEIGRDNGMHALRHFYASVLLDAGESIKALSEYLGHHDPGFTLRTYTHLMPSSEARTRAAVDSVFQDDPSTEDGPETAQGPA